MQAVSVRKNSQLDQLGELLATSRIRLDTAAVSVPHMRSVLFRYNISALMARQEELERQYAAALSREGQEGDLGWLVPVGIAVTSLVGVMGAWIYKQHEETAEVEGRMDIYDRLVEAGYSAEDAGNLAFGKKTGVGDILNKLILISAIGAGILVFLKFK